MSSDLHSGRPDATSNPAPHPLPLGWVKARFADIMIVAEVLHEARWAAPWDVNPHSNAKGLETNIPRSGRNRGLAGG